jgi:hypothetical protein
MGFDDSVHNEYMQLLDRLLDIFLLLPYHSSPSKLGFLHVFIDMIKKVKKL